MKEARQRVIIKVNDCMGDSRAVQGFTKFIPPFGWDKPLPSLSQVEVEIEKYDSG